MAMQAVPEREGVGFSFALDGGAKKPSGITYSEPEKDKKP
jgi:hypothetical protein